MAKVQNKKINDENEMSKFIKIIIIVAVIALFFYFLTVIITAKNKKTTTPTSKTQATIQYDEILIGNIFKQPNNNYYVLIEDAEDKNVDVYLVYLSTYKTKENAKRVYTAVLNNLFNKKYMDTTSNISNDINTFKVSKTTLLEISKGKISKVYEKDEDILKLLQDLTK